MKKSHFIPVIVAIAVVLVALACGPKSGSDATAAAGKTIKAVPLGNLTATLSNDAGVLKHGNQELILSFTDASGKTVDVGAASLNFHMPQMGTMAEMNDGVTFTTTRTPGVYRGKVDIEVGGEYQAQLAYEGPAGKGKTTFSLVVQ